MPDLDQLVNLFSEAQESGYVLLNDDLLAIGYFAMSASDYRRVNFIVEQANIANRYMHRDQWQMAKYQDGTYGIR